MNKTLRRTLSAIALSALLAGLTLTPVMAAQRDSSPTAASTSICTQQITGSAAAPASARQLQQQKSSSSIDRNVLRSGRLIIEGGNIRYQRSSGDFLKNGWRKYHGKKYYFDSRGYAVKGMQEIKNKRYIFDSAGVLQKGWVKYNSRWYYASPRSGRLRSGWQTVEGKRYYLSPSDKYMLTGFQTIGGKNYYFNASGVLQTTRQVIGGKEYRFNADGTVYPAPVPVAPAAPAAAPAAPTASAPATPAAVSTARGQQVANFALKYVGNPYRWGGSSLTKGADCSGFVMAVYNNFGIQLPHYDASIRKRGTQIASLSQALPGDVICYRGHVAIYLGNNRIVHAANTRQGICIGQNAAYDRILSIRRFFL